MSKKSKIRKSMINNLNPNEPCNLCRYYCEMLAQSQSGDEIVVAQCRKRAPGFDGSWPIIPRNSLGCGDYAAVVHQ